MRSDDKGKFKTDIGEDVIAEALRSVEKRGGTPQSGAVEFDLEQPAPPGTEPGPADSVATPAASEGPSADSAELQELRAELELSQAQSRDLMTRFKEEHEKLLRVAADLENYKKRAQKEREELQKFGIEKLLRDFLPVVDNFDRALEAARGQADFGSLRTGVEMIRKLFEDTLGKHGVKSFSAKGALFDPNFHEAMSAVQTTEVPPNHVVTEVLRGFTLNDRLVRPAAVVVARAPEVAAPATASPTGADSGSPPGSDGDSKAS